VCYRGTEDGGAWTRCHEFEAKLGSTARPAAALFDAASQAAVLLRHGREGLKQHQVERSLYQVESTTMC
jgi:hypothetical protein